MAPGIIGPNGGLFNSSSTVQIDENSALVFDFDSNQVVNWSISGGQDGHLLTIDPYSGILSFNNAPDYENPADYPDIGYSDNNYNVTISAKNSSGSTSYQAVSIRVKDVSEGSSSPTPTPTPAPTPTPTPEPSLTSPPGIAGPDGGLFNSSSTASVNENSKIVFDFYSNQDVTWGNVGGQDGHLFSIDPYSGVLSFIEAPDYENPIDYPDRGFSDNGYVVTVSAKNSMGYISYHTINVRVNDLEDISEATAQSVVTTGDENSFESISLSEIEPLQHVTVYELSESIEVGGQGVGTLIHGTYKKDIITGSSAGEVLAGGEGKDVLRGGGGPDGFLFQNPDGFGKKEADRIIDFDAREGDSLIVSEDVFDLNDRILIKKVTGKKAAKKSDKAKEDFVYDDKKGFLYFNENGKEKGWGDGGLFVKLQDAPELGVSDFTFL